MNIVQQTSAGELSPDRDEDCLYVNEYELYQHYHRGRVVRDFISHNMASDDEDGESFTFILC